MVLSLLLHDCNPFLGDDFWFHPPDCDLCLIVIMMKMMLVLGCTRLWLLKPLLSTACEYTGRMLRGHHEGGCGDDLWSMMYDHIDDYLMILLYNAAAMADCYYDEDDDGMCLVETFAPFCDHRNHALWPQPSRAPTKSWTQETRKTETQLSVAWHRTITETRWLQTFQAKESPSCRSSNTLPLRWFHVAF